MIKPYVVLLARIQLATVLCVSATVFAAEPRVLIEGAKLELVAAEPDIVTPVGMTFDAAGRLLVIESHTHQRPDGYKGPEDDRVRMLSDSDGDGTLDTWSTFADGFQQSMNLLSSGPGRVFLVTRRSVDLLLDEDNDGHADRQESVLKLDTKVDYPHNAMSALAFDSDGGLYVGLGENSGEAYRLVGSDGKSYSDTGGVGTIFRCAADGSNLRRFSNGFWNPFSIEVLSTGQVFTVDNDPDSSPPCRLIHVVETGDYGHRFEYSRAGTHPLQAWDGELPGTLPMLAGTGEAPCAVVSHRGFLWVTSWGDHRLERYRLKPNGATFSAQQDIAVQGDSDFRPTGCAIAPDGSLYFADWVDHSYPVHGKGRIWRLSFDDDAETSEVDSANAKVELKRRNVWRTTDLFERQAAVADWARNIDSSIYTGGSVPSKVANERLGQAQACRWSKKAVSDEMFRAWLADDDDSVRLYAVRWIADERIQSLRDDIEELLAGEIPNERFYMAVLSAVEWLDGEAKMRSSTLNDGLLVRELKNKSRSPRLRALALRLISPDNKYLTLDRLQTYLASDYLPMRLEALRTLALQANPKRFGLLVKVALDPDQPALIRADAISGLAATEQFAQKLSFLSQEQSSIVREEALRTQRLRGEILAEDEAKPDASDLDQWYKLLNGKGDVAAGRRLFFSARGARCGVCHQHEGRGGKIGPDLTSISKSNSREQIITSILQPSRDMAPHYQPWKLQTSAGKTLLALRLHKSGDGGEEIYANSEGETFGLRGDEIDLRQASEISLMPSGLEKTVSIRQLLDLVEFLSAGE